MRVLVIILSLMFLGCENSKPKTTLFEGMVEKSPNTKKVCEEIRAKVRTFGNNKVKLKNGKVIGVPEKKDDVYKLIELSMTVPPLNEESLLLLNAYHSGNEAKREPKNIAAFMALTGKNCSGIAIMDLFRIIEGSAENFGITDPKVDQALKNLVKLQWQTANEKKTLLSVAILNLLLAKESSSRLFGFSEKQMGEISELRKQSRKEGREINRKMAEDRKLYNVSLWQKIVGKFTDENYLTDLTDPQVAKAYNKWMEYEFNLSNKILAKIDKVVGQHFEN